MKQILAKFNFLTFTILSQLLYFATSQSSQSAQLESTSGVVPLRYLIFSEECYGTFFLKQQLEWSCIKFSAVKLLGYGVVTGAAIVKLPQILKIIEKKSAFGVSFSSVTFEVITQILVVTYNVYRGNPFSIYGESVLIALQMFIIIGLFLAFDKEQKKPIYVSALIACSFLAWSAYHPHLTPTWYLENTIILQMLMIIIARTLQILHCHQVNSTGSLSIITCGLTVLGNLARIITVWVEVGDDWKYKISYLIAVALNGYILLLFFVLRQKKNKTE